MSAVRDDKLFAIVTGGSSGMRYDAAQVLPVGAYRPNKPASMTDKLGGLASSTTEDEP